MNLEIQSSLVTSLSLRPQVLVLLGRAVNIFPLSFLLNFFRDHKITPKMMFIMWFSGEGIQSPLRQADNIWTMFLLLIFFFVLWQVCVVPSPTPSASTWAWSPLRSGSWLAPPPSSSCSSPSSSSGVGPCRLSASWTSRKASHGVRTWKTSISARRRRW